MRPTRHWKTIILLVAVGLLSFQIVLLLTSEATTAAIVETEQIEGQQKNKLEQSISSKTSKSLKVYKSKSQKEKKEDKKCNEK